MPLKPKVKTRAFFAPLLLLLLLVPACSPTRPTAPDLNAQALTALNDHQDPRAQSLLNQSLAADPRYAPAHNNLGLLYFRQNNLPQATAEFQTAARLAPHNPQPLNNLGLTEERANHLDQAIAHYTQALDLDPANPQLMGNLARARLKRGDPPSTLHSLLVTLANHDPRPDWSAWARQQLALEHERAAP